MTEEKGRGDDGVCLECSRRGEVEGMGLTRSAGESYLERLG